MEFSHVSFIEYISKFTIGLNDQTVKKNKEKTLPLRTILRHH